MIPRRLSKLASLAKDGEANPEAVLTELVRQIEASKDGDGLRELTTIEGLEDIFLGEADAPETVGAALARFALGHSDDPLVWAVIHAALGIPIEQALLRAETSQKPQLLRGVEGEIRQLRLVVGRKDPPLGALLLLARLPSATVEDLALLAKHLRSTEASLTAGLSIALLTRRLHVNAGHPDVHAASLAMEKVVAKLPAKPMEKTVLPLALAAAGLLLLGSNRSDVSAALGMALTVPASVPLSWGFALAPRARTTSDLLIAVLRFVAEADGLKDLAPLLSTLAEVKLARADAHEVIAKLLVSIGFPSGIPEGPGLRMDRLRPIEREVLQALRNPRFERADMSMRALGFWSHQALVEFLAESGPQFRSIELSAGGRAPAIWVWRATAIGALSQKDAFDALVRCGEPPLLGELVLSRRERPITEALLKTPADDAREQSLALALIEWLEAHDSAWLARLAKGMQGPYEAAFVALGILRAAEKGLITLGAEHDALFEDAFLSARVLEPTLSLVKRLPQGARLLSTADGIFCGM